MRHEEIIQVLVLLRGSVGDKDFASFGVAALRCFFGVALRAVFAEDDDCRELLGQRDAAECAVGKRGDAR